MTDIRDVEKTILRITERIVEIRDELTEMDSKLGDGDLGISMAKGADAVRRTVEAFAGEDMQTLFLQCAAALNKAAPSTMGTLLSGGLMALARHLTDKAVLTVEEIVIFPEILAGAIAARGKAQTGDKTILDSLIPYAKTLKNVYEESGSVDNAKREALDAAKRGMESTRGMTARTGRASWLGERNKEFPDAGACMFYRIAEIL